MPHRSEDVLNELDQTLKEIMESPNSIHVVLAGDFNCPDINWETSSVAAGSPDRDIQEHLIDVMTDSHFTEVHETETREGKMLDLFFTANPTPVKSSLSIQDIYGVFTR